MIPYADFTYFGLSLYLLAPTLILGLFGRAGARWALTLTLIVLVVQYDKELKIYRSLVTRETWIVAGYGAFQVALAKGFLWIRSLGNRRVPFYTAVSLSLLPLALAKFLPFLLLNSQFGFLGISYVTFRALDVVFCIQDQVITELPVTTYLGFLFFFPTISSGPIDRYKRFAGDWKISRTRAQFLADLDGAFHRLFRGFLYKFIIAALIKLYLLDPFSIGNGWVRILVYMYAYSFYLFFDFAGYCAFAIAFSYLLGVHTPENFNKPFLARNIRDFWNRWNITLSFWFRDHVYMRFLLSAMRGKWFRSKHTASYLGFFLSFGLMGLWHGLAPCYLIYGFYHGALLTGYDLFARWNKTHHLWSDGPLWRVAGIAITFHAVCFGLLIFSGRLGGSEM